MGRTGCALQFLLESEVGYLDYLEEKSLTLHKMETDTILKTMGKGYVQQAPLLQIQLEQMLLQDEVLLLLHCC